MKIGIDLDGTLYEHPEFFKQLMKIIDAHFYITSGHTIERFRRDDVIKLRKLGFEINKLYTTYLPQSEEQYNQIGGPKWKAKVADNLHVVFDNDASAFQHLTKTPIIKVLPKK